MSEIPENIKVICQCSRIIVTTKDAENATCLCGLPINLTKSPTDTPEKYKCEDCGEELPIFEDIGIPGHECKPETTASTWEGSERFNEITFDLDFSDKEKLIVLIREVEKRARDTGYEEGARKQAEMDADLVKYAREEGRREGMQEEAHNCWEHEEKAREEGKAEVLEELEKLLSKYGVAVPYVDATMINRAMLIKLLTPQDISDDERLKAGERANWRMSQEDNQKG